MNILLTSVGRRGYLVQYFKQALNGMGKIHVANSSPITPAFSYADRWVVTPLIYDKDYIHFLIQYCETNNIDAIISLFDIDLPILASHKDLFQDHGMSLLVSDIDVNSSCNEKWHSMPKNLSFVRNRATCITRRLPSVSAYRKAAMGNGLNCSTNCR